MPYGASKLKCVSSALVSEEHRQGCFKMRTSTREIPLSLFPITKPPTPLSLPTDKVPSPVLSRGQPVAGQDASEPPAVSPTEWTEKKIHRDQAV